MARVVVDAWRVAYKGIVSDEYLDGLKYEARENSFRERILEKDSGKLIYVYEDERINKIVGIIYFGKPLEEIQYGGEIYDLYVLPAFQKQGIGRQLIKEAINKLGEINCKNIIIWALKDNINARKFYEKIGGKLTSEKSKEIGGEMLDEVSYVLEI